jgi:N-acyl-D-aspartate/D-glutamate deacylase
MEPSAADYVTAMLARVEGMPLDSVRAGVDLDWRTFGEYLDRLDGRLSLNAGFLVGHSTVRRVVLGDDWQRAATDDEITAMCRTVAESLAAGALGFSSSWSETHNDDRGEPVPSRYSTEEELLRICAELRTHPGTWLEFIPMATGRFPHELALLMARMSAAAQRPLNWNLLNVTENMKQELLDNRLAPAELAAELGGAVLALSLPISQALHLNLDSGFLFDTDPTWAEVLGLPRDEKARALRDPEVRARLVDAARSRTRIWFDPERLFVEHVASDRHATLAGLSLADAARADGREPFDLMFDLALDDDFRTGFLVPAHEDDASTWQRRAEVWKDPRVIVGGSDAGAHLDMAANFGFFTDFVGPTVRDRHLLSLETAVRMLTDDAARAFGIRGRGRVEPGYAADLVVLDEHEVGTGPVDVRADLPAGGMRLYAGAAGISEVLVNGETIVRDGALTGARPGTLLRSGRDTDTVVPAAAGV